ncbi:MAG: MucB/RseB C-terminal domain-containing protein [Porticoccus sp.]|nr:MucB/RseB C-terminal domain-containing protein [Porticoccus sp.]
MKYSFRCCGVLLLALVATSASYSLDDLSSVTKLLQRMSEANRQLSYQGVFTYEHGGALKTVKAYHSVRDGQEFERIIHLSGPKREVVRRGSNLDCQRLGDAMLRSSPVGLSDISRGHIENNYSLYKRGEDRVAGRDVDIIHVVPKDSFRYGYALGLDKETGLLLQSMLIGNDKRVLERFQFVDITIGSLVDDMVLEPTSSDHHQVSTDVSPCLDEKGNISSESTRHWLSSWLPPGFALSGYHTDPDNGRETLIYTDGLAVFSVFIDSGDVLNAPTMQAQRGATVAFLSHIEYARSKYIVCVVGEIPIETAKKVSQSITRIQ